MSSRQQIADPSSEVTPPQVFECRITLLDRYIFVLSMCTRLFTPSHSSSTVPVTVTWVILVSVGSIMGDCFHWKVQTVLVLVPKGVPPVKGTSFVLIYYLRRWMWGVVLSSIWSRRVKHTAWAKPIAWLRKNKWKYFIIYYPFGGQY